MSRVFELSIPAMEKFLLLAMADHARDDGTGCYPSVGRLARKTSLSERGVQKLIRRMEQKGFLVARGKAKGGRGITVEYSLTLEKGERRSPFEEETPNCGAAKRVNESAKNPERGSPEPSGTIKSLEPGGAKGGGCQDHGETASAFSSFGFATPFGHVAFQVAVAERARRGAMGDIILAMEDVVQACGCKVPPKWFEKKRELEREARGVAERPRSREEERHERSQRAIENVFGHRSKLADRLRAGPWRNAVHSGRAIDHSHERVIDNSPEEGTQIGG